MKQLILGISMISGSIFGVGRADSDLHFLFQVGVEILCSAEDLKLSLQHNLATYIKEWYWATLNGKIYAKRANIHFVQVRMVFCRLEKVYGIISFNSVQQAGCPLTNNLP